MARAPDNLAHERVPQNFRTVIVAASVGNVIEWYDFYIFASLTSILPRHFFGTATDIAFLATLATYVVGFLVRPLGAFFFGWLGDKVGRKYTFLVTLTGMGVGTALIGVIPSYADIGIAAGIVLLAFRVIQGLCLGGEYGGAITYVAEHVSDARRGYYTGWLQTSPTLGIVVSLLATTGTNIAFTSALGVGPGQEAFSQWGWRIPFLISFLLVAVAIYIRLQLQETPIFQQIKAKGQMVKNPWKEAFISKNIKYVLIASVCVFGQGVVWYSSQYTPLVLMLPKLSGIVGAVTVNGMSSQLTVGLIMGIGLVIGTPSLIIFGWLSDRIGRKPVILGGMLLAALLYYPLFMWLGSVTEVATHKNGMDAMDWISAIFIIVVLVSFVGMTYGPIGAFLAEFFPGRIRYTSVSVPYHIGNGWGGGLANLIPSVVWVLTATAGNASAWDIVTGAKPTVAPAGYIPGVVASTLAYSIAVPAICFLICLFLLPETRHISIWDPEKGREVPA